MNAFSSGPEPSDQNLGFVSISVAGQLFGLPVEEVQDVTRGGRINAIPLAPAEIAGAMNLRGRIATAIDLRARLAFEPRSAGESFYCVLVERAGDLFALLADDVGDVMWFDAAARSAPPANLRPDWRNLVDGLLRLEDQLVLTLAVNPLLDVAPG